MIPAGSVMRGVIEEKQSRIVEIVVSSVKPTEMMLGKLIGIGISTSGNSKNVIKAVEAAKAKGITTVALCGAGLKHTDIELVADPTLPPGTNASRLEVVSDSGQLKMERLGLAMPDNPKTGVLTAQTESNAGSTTTGPVPPIPVGASPLAMITDSAGKLVFVANQGDSTVSVFTINRDTGALSAAGNPVPTAPATGPSGLAVSGNRLFVANLTGGISVFTFDAGTGALTPVAGSPFAAGTSLCSPATDQDVPMPCGIALDAAGKTLYVPDKAGNAVHLGPVTITGANITGAQASLQGDSQSLAQWTVDFTLDSAGADAFAKATTEAVNQTPPQNQIGIAVDYQIISNPVVQDPITGGRGQITGNFTEQDAKDLAAILNAGSLPVNLTQESVRTVSPTLGSTSLREGIIAGAAGLILLFMYLLFYYRLLGVVAWFGMSIWAVLAITLISVAGQRFGYALTLAGVAGLVISLGVTADSYIVFFERLKDEVRAGRSPRTAVQPAFQRAFKTIVAADIVTGIAAAVLYFTAVSSVRGFALTLGVATALDLFAVYFFKRPTVFLIARNERLVRLRGFGLSSGVAAEGPAIGEGDGA